MSTKQVVLSAVLVAFGASSAMAATIQVSTTIKVTSGTYNGGGNTYVSKGLGDGGQGESQSPIFRVENGATLTNAIIGAPAADGIHMYNGATLNNVSWTDVGEDAATVKKSTGTSQVFRITGGSTRKSADKTFQVNAASTLIISGHNGDGFTTFVRQNGGTSYKCDLRVQNSTIKNGRRGIYTNSTTTVISTSGTSFSNVTNKVQINSTVR